MTDIDGYNGMTRPHCKKCGTLTELMRVEDGENPALLRCSFVCQSCGTSIIVMSDRWSGRGEHDLRLGK